MTQEAPRSRGLASQDFASRAFASLWSATAAPAPATEPLTQSALTDVLVIGAGYLGLSTALHLAEQGVSVTVLEARDIGHGGSGRSGGQLIPGLKHDPDDIVRQLGAERGARLVNFAGGTAKFTLDLIDRYNMDVPTARAGWVQGAHTSEALALAHARAEQWARHVGADTQILSSDEAAELLGTTRYLGGWLDKRGGAVQPLSYARGLACAALSVGARIHTNSPVVDITRQGAQWVAKTEGGAQVAANRVVLCTNAYTGAFDQDLWPGLRQSIVNPVTYQVATKPLPPEILKTILPQDHVSSDTRQLLLYFRKDHQGRVLMGGRGPFREPRSAADWAHLERVLVKMYPQLAAAPIEFRWCGRVAVTRGYWPHLHQPAPGFLVEIGCQGRGVGLQSAMGQVMAQYLVEGDAGVLPFALTAIERLPFHGLRRVYVGAVAAWYRLRDGGM